jgi:eukaryotic-like serine/threonine-protein kinase
MDQSAFRGKEYEPCRGGHRSPGRGAAPGRRREPPGGEAPQAVRDDLVMERFRLLERIGSGGMGTVYRAFDERLQRQVAVKEINGGDPARVLREAQAAARLNHPAIVTLYELGERAGRVLLVSELVPGATLTELRDAGTLSDREVGELAADVCDALAHAHAHGVTHRDVKPENVIVSEDAHVGKRAKLMDFGVARINGAESLTAAGEVVGTLAYMSPEQAEGSQVGPASDVYSLGLTFYELWAGENPVAGRSPAQTARRIGADLPSLAEYRPDLPADLTTAVDACLEPHPELRPDAVELRERFEAELDGLDAEGAIPAPAAEPEPDRTPNRLVATTALISLALAMPAVGLAAAAPALVGLVPRAFTRAVLGFSCWAWALVVTDAAVGAEAIATGAVFAAAAVALGPVLATRHLALALVGAVIWSATYGAALSLVGGAGLELGPPALVVAAVAVLGLEFGLLRAPADEAPGAVTRPARRALSGRLA